MIKRVEIFTREEDQEEAVKIFEIGKTKVTVPKFKNPSLRRCGLVVEYKNGHTISVAQHKGTTAVVSSRTKKEYNLSWTQFLDVEVYSRYCTLLHCDPKGRIFTEETPEEVIDSLRVYTRIKNETDYERMEIDFSDKLLLKKLNQSWLDSFEVEDI
ncbi:MAG: hypothetical protein ACRCX2_03610 [Paraclostridium sp.]